MKSISNLMNLSGRVALITGGAGHLGSAMGEALAEVGASVVLLDLAQESGIAVADQIQQEYGVETLFLKIDLADEVAIRSVSEKILNRFGRLDILINCAALVGTSGLKGYTTSFDQQRVDTWRLAMDINLTAPFILVQACKDLLLASGHGCVINISSIYGLQGPVPQLYRSVSSESLGDVPAVYAASKGGLVQFTRWMATTLAPQIRANAITVGGVWRNQNEAFCERYQERTPLNRMASEQDLKGAVVYLASDLSEYVTGHNLIVDGGWSVW